MKKPFVIDTCWQSVIKWCATGYISHTPGQVPCPVLGGHRKQSTFCCGFFVSFLHLLTVFYSFDFCLWILICFGREKGGKEHTVGLVERWGNLGGAAEGKEHNKNILYEKI